MTLEEAADSIDNSYFAKIVEDEITDGDSAVDNELDGETEGVNTDTSHMVRDSLLEALEATAEDASSPEDEEETARRIEDEKILATVPEIPESLGGSEKTDENGLVYLTYTFTVDPTQYRSNNYMPIQDAASAKKVADNKSLADSKADDGSGGQEITDEEIDAAMAEEVGNGEDEKTAADESPESVAFDYATAIDGSSCWCFDEVEGIDYTSIALDAAPKAPPTKANCKTTFAQCRAKNPLYCRFHGPKLLEQDIRTALTAILGKNSGCVVSVTKDKNSKNPMTFRLTVGCLPYQKKKVEEMIHKFLTQNPGISGNEEWKNLGKKNGKEMKTTEFDLDILKVDDPPQKGTNKASKAAWLTQQAKEKGIKQGIVGETPSQIEKMAKSMDAGAKALSNWFHDADDWEGDYLEALNDYLDKESDWWKNTPDEEAKNEITEQANLLKKLSGKEYGDLMPIVKALNAVVKDTPKTKKTSTQQEDSTGIGDAGDVPEKPSVQSAAKGETSSEVANDPLPETSHAPAEKTESQSDADAFEQSDGSNDEPAKKALAAADSIASQFNETSGANLDKGCIAAHRKLDFVTTALKNSQTNLDSINSALASVGGDATTIGQSVIGKALLNSKADIEAELPSQVQAVEDATAQLTKAIESMKAQQMEIMKSYAAAKVEGIVLKLASALWPSGTVNEAGSVEELLDSKENSLDEYGKSLGLTEEEMKLVKNKHGFDDAYSEANVESKEFNAAIDSFKDMMDAKDEELDFDKLDKASIKIGFKGNSLEKSVKAFDEVIAKIKAEMDFGAEMKKAEKKSENKPETKTDNFNLARQQNSPQSGGAETNKVSSTETAATAKKTYTKEMLAQMSPKEKLQAAIAIAKKKLAASPNDEDLKAKLAKWEKQLASIH